ncbi:MAG: DICT sensory domain-containing protein [Haloferacaceae archaeon]
MPAELAAFLDEPEDPPRSLAVVNRTEPEPIQRMLDRLFEFQSVSVEERSLPEGENLVLLLGDGEVLATSTLAELQRSILLVNSDLYVTGTRELDEVELPAVLAALDDVPFRLRGYPASSHEKLLLITISRVIERRAWEADGGTLRSSFQRLSRIEDERGTREVYEQLADSGVDAHVYGLPNWTPTREFPLTMHGGFDADFRDSWFVVFTPPADGDAEPVALLAIETERNSWEGFWTYRPELVAGVNRYIERNL